MIRLSDAACSWAGLFLGLGLILVSQHLAFRGLVGGRLVMHQLSGTEVIQRRGDGLWFVSDQWIVTLHASNVVTITGLLLLVLGFIGGLWRTATKKPRLQASPRVLDLLKGIILAGVLAFVISVVGTTIVQNCMRPISRSVGGYDQIGTLGTRGATTWALNGRFLLSKNYSVYSVTPW